MDIVPMQDLGGEAATVRSELKKERLFAAGGIFGAIAASSCCILPLVLFSLGMGGAWIGNLTALAPYQPIFVVITLGFLGCGYWLVYRKTKVADLTLATAEMGFPSSLKE